MFVLFTYKDESSPVAEVVIAVNYTESHGRDPGTLEVVVPVEVTERVESEWLPYQIVL